MSAPINHKRYREKAVEEKDYIIRGVNGELYPCKADIFEKTYEKVTDDENG